MEIKFSEKKTLNYFVKQIHTTILFYKTVNLKTSTIFQVKASKESFNKKQTFCYN